MNNIQEIITISLERYEKMIETQNDLLDKIKHYEKEREALHILFGDALKFRYNDNKLEAFLVNQFLVKGYDKSR